MTEGTMKLAMIELEDVMTDTEASFSETHRRRIDLPLDQVWQAALELPAAEIRTFGPLMAVRKLPAVLLGKREDDRHREEAFLDGFEDGGFAVLRRDDEPTEGRALVLFGAAGKFWKPVGNQPVPFEDPLALAHFDKPKHAVIAATMEAIDRGDHTELVTKTRVRGTDRGSTIRFAPYWALIRPFSGLIRRSWLVAIERRARRSCG